MSDRRPVLLVDDDTIDAMTVKRSFRDLKVTHPLVHTLNGEDALAHLAAPGNTPPWLILLDLNMPKMNGLEFLRVVKSDPELRKTPVVILTTSSKEQDITACFQLNVAGYIVKPIDYGTFVEIVRAVDLYWALNELPGERAEDDHADNTISAVGGG